MFCVKYCIKPNKNINLQNTIFKKLYVFMHKVFLHIFNKSEKTGSKTNDVIVQTVFCLFQNFVVSKLP